MPGLECPWLQLEAECCAGGPLGLGGGGDEGDITRADLQVAPEVVLFNLELRKAWSAMPAGWLVALAGFSNPFLRRGLPEVGLGSI